MSAVDVRLEGLAPGGDAVGRQEGGEHAGRVTFVALGAPGDRVRVRLLRQKARVAWGELEELVDRSPDRVAPACPLFGSCGGCQWQHVALPRQRAAKRAIVARALGLADVELRVPAESGARAGDGAGSGFHYRDRVRLAVGPDGALGFHARRSHAVVDVPACPLLTPALARALAGVRAAEAAALPAGTTVELQAGAEGVHATLRSGASVDGAALLAAWRAAGVVGVTVGARRFGAGEVDVSEPGGPPLPVPAGAFAQVGRAANAALVRAVLDAVGPEPGAVLELYAGSGNFTRHLAARAASLVACEADAAARERGRRAVPAASWLPRPPAAAAVAAPDGPDTVVADPPRAGLDAEHLGAARRARRRLVYVSCDPQTLGRDAVRLRQAGLGLAGAVALDLMPHTFHVEVVAAFEPARVSADD